ncbi:DNA topoisomerase 3 [Pseudoalteromonas sp. CIP111854]|uniref:DNA topoisomerase n=1 Tax=Pseudoalteromonas holothuriae TaxID=2963714 RepID=A0A9W4QZ68_9GAMM|nr:DNA topoisomerase III [Pseudoalteromonas sp. CIP111854]CAH9059833.1 DNA topoisomerase 3 [Pseudoalteromonas sp. CIP111854]
MKLYIAEKPSLGRAIADALPKPHKKQDGFIEAGDGSIVSWCIGHLLEQAEPEDYDSKYKKWQQQDLPIVPQQWQFKAKPKTKKQLSVLKKLIKRAKMIIHAGDPDREGQLLVDEVLQFIGLTSQQKQTTQRLLISDLNLPAVKRALAAMQPNKLFVPLSVSALARARADWLYGMNLTRAFTLVGKKSGYQGVLSVGRVQTPVLGLVVRRDKEITEFVSKPFYEVFAHLATQAGEEFIAKWRPSDACKPYLDEENRVLVKELAENVVSRIKGQPGEVSKLEQKPKKQAPPLPYNLSALQIDAGKVYGMSAKQVLDICQGLYERHKLITYPRSDNRYLPSEHYQHRQTVLKAVLNNKGCSKEQIEGADLSLRSKCWNDKKVEAHHAIIPTVKQLKSAQLGSQELQVYTLISRQYLAQFYSPFSYHETTAHITVAGGLFIAKAKQVNEVGFKVLFTKQSKDEESLSSFLPPLQQGQKVQCVDGQVQEKHTQPPQYYTDATLLSAMTGINRYVKDSEIKKILKETDGLGTEATRAGIIELLFKRDFLRREGKQIRASEVGHAMVDMLPESLTLPDRTALWESHLAKIASKECTYTVFMEPLITQLHDFVYAAKQTQSPNLKGLTKPRNFKRKFKKRSRNTTKANN